MTTDDEATPEDMETLADAQAMASALVASLLDQPQGGFNSAASELLTDIAKRISAPLGPRWDAETIEEELANRGRRAAMIAFVLSKEVASLIGICEKAAGGEIPGIRDLYNSPYSALLTR